MQIKVTKDDIYTDRKARHGNAQTCMVWAALARRLDLPEDSYLNVTGHYATLSGNGARVEVELSEDVADKIDRWDRGQFIGEFEFEFNPPADWREKITGHK